MSKLAAGLRPTRRVKLAAAPAARPAVPVAAPSNFARIFRCSLKPPWAALAGGGSFFRSFTRFGLPRRITNNWHRHRCSTAWGPRMLFALHEITKTYGKITALRQLSVSVPPGAVGLLGPNGAGKTTLIRTLLGLISVDAGGGQVLGMDIHARRLDIRQAVGFAPEDECLFPGVAGIESCAYAGELCGMAFT